MAAASSTHQSALDQKDDNSYAARYRHYRAAHEAIHYILSTLQRPITGKHPPEWAPHKEPSIKSLHIHHTLQDPSHADVPLAQEEILYKQRQLAIQESIQSDMAYMSYCVRRAFATSTIFGAFGAGITWFTSRTTLPIATRVAWTAVNGLVTFFIPLAYTTNECVEKFCYRNSPIAAQAREMYVSHHQTNIRHHSPSHPFLRHYAKLKPTLAHMEELQTQHMLQEKPVRSILQGDQHH